MGSGCERVNSAIHGLTPFTNSRPDPYNDHLMTWRQRFACIVVLIASAAALPAVAAQAQKQKKPAAPAPVDVKVYLTPTCGCCGIWADHMSAAKFNVTREVTRDLQAVPVRQRVPAQLQTCHTAVVGNYIVEGHVPADVVRQMLKEKPNIVGIAVPGMPMGSPGMEGPNPRSYSIIAFRADGTTYEYARR